MDDTQPAGYLTLFYPTRNTSSLFYPTRNVYTPIEGVPPNITTFGTGCSKPLKLVFHSILVHFDPHVFLITPKEDCASWVGPCAAGHVLALMYPNIIGTDYDVSCLFAYYYGMLQ